MLRKIALLGSTVALVGSALFMGGAAHAGGTLDASHYTVSCDTMTKGTVGFVPALTLAGTSPEAVKIKGALSGCTATPDGSNPAVQVLSATVSGALTGGTNSCLSLLGPSTATGTITIKWKTVPALLNATTTITINSGNVSGGTAFPFSDAAAYGNFSISGTTQTGAFGGPSGTGAASFTKALTVQGVSGLTPACTSATGLKGVALGSTEVFLG